MILNLLTDLVDPDNIPDGYGGLDPRPLLTLAITIIAILVTIITTAIIYNLSKEKQKECSWIRPTIIISDILICIILIIMCYFAVQK